MFAVFTKKYLLLYDCVATNWRLQLTVHTQKPKYVVVPWKYKIIKIKVLVLIKNIPALSATQFFGYS